MPNTDSEFYTQNYHRHSCHFAYAYKPQLPYWIKRRKHFPSTAFESAKKDFTLSSQEKGCLVYNTTFWIKAASAAIEMKL